MQNITTLSHAFASLLFGSAASLGLDTFSINLWNVTDENYSHRFVFLPLRLVRIFILKCFYSWHICFFWLFCSLVELLSQDLSLNSIMMSTEGPLLWPYMRFNSCSCSCSFFFFSNVPVAAIKDQHVTDFPSGESTVHAPPWSVVVLPTAPYLNGRPRQK